MAPPPLWESLSCDKLWHLFQVIKNRIHSFRAYGIAVRGRAKALVQENIIFQGKASKTVFQQIPNNRECIMQNNKFLVFKKK